ncbi:cysteine dioxygenase family protein [Luteimonas sp. FCS-9]|uniref:cysteine dioxygenase family protein n=1 Tax=Luteimonas sp. FCS-9 TaxID=1547516 RepID=UPI00063E9C16|nr:cysteine dioxygenase family protein [Luteimonas sp. FCS-9]KLJ01637.1 cysteine dioxygenase [Luteimonas sp. FCS-9]
MPTATPPLPDIGHPGRDRLVAAVDAAVAHPDAQAVTAALREAMQALIRDPAVRLPPCVYAPVDGHYARRELYRSPRHGYSIVAMTWAPGQGTPLHDHDELWCVEGVWHGALEIVQYERLEQAGARYRFRPAVAVQAQTGSAGSLIPPHEYHVIRNADPAVVAVSLHIYQAPILRCAQFVPQGDEWYLRREAAMQTDAVGPQD